MGLSIHYKGEFKRGESLSTMIEEVKEFADVYNWKYNIFEENFEEELGKEDYNDKVYGICFTPPECETIFLTFLSNGKMCSVINLQLYGENPEEQKHMYQLFVKTQYAGIEIHKLIIHFFRYLNKKYFVNFTLTDEGQYWETGDENLLQENFARYTDLIESFRNSLEIFPKQNEESFEEYFGRLISRIDKKRKNS